MKFHPDRTAGDKKAEESFKEVAEAYEVLHDPEKRAHYDRFGHAAGAPAGGGGGAEFEGFDLADALRAFMRDFGGMGGGGFGDVFESQMGGRRAGPSERRGGEFGKRPPPPPGGNANGVGERVQNRRMTPCSVCGGTRPQDGTGKRK